MQRFLVLIIAVSVLLVSAGHAIAQTTPKTSYELFYPIVAGKIPGEKWYTFKILREKVVGALLFNVIKKSQYYMSLSKKRLVEAEKLIVVNNDYKLGLQTLEEASKNLKTAWQLLINEDANNELKNDTLVITDFLINLAEKMPPESKSKVKEYSNIARGLIK